MAEKNMHLCVECGWTGNHDEIDFIADPRPLPNTAPNIWLVCPKCRTPDQILPLCDEPGCKIAGTCGTPTTGGYRWTCSKHRPDNFEG